MYVFTTIDKPLHMSIHARQRTDITSFQASCVCLVGINVHFKANLYDPGEMMEKITGKKLTPEPFIEYLEKKYSALFL